MKNSNRFKHLSLTHLETIEDHEYFDTERYETKKSTIGRKDRAEQNKKSELQRIERHY